MKRKFTFLLLPILFFATCKKEKNNNDLAIAALAVASNSSSSATTILANEEETTISVEAEFFDPDGNPVDPVILTEEEFQAKFNTNASLKATNQPEGRGFLKKLDFIIRIKN